MLNIDSFREIVKTDLGQVDALILKYLQSDIPLAQELAEHIIQSGGKRLRPILVLLAARLFHDAMPEHCKLAAIVELIHSATLLHDDVVDHSEMRRGRPTANAVFGNSASVLVGDFLYSRAFEIMVDIGHLPILHVLAQASNVLAEGEILQLSNCRIASLSEERYLDTIQRKTATLFEASAQLGAILHQRPAEEVLALAQYGRFLGIAFQLVDDAFDYGASNTDIGKNFGDDLAEGKVTLPLIYAMKNGTTDQKQQIEHIIKTGAIHSLPDIIEIFASTQAIEYTYQLAENYVKMAIEALQIFSESQIRIAMEALAQFAIKRSH